MEILFVVIGIVVLWQLFSLRARVEALEHTLKQSSVVPSTTVQTENEPAGENAAALAQLRLYIKDQFSRGAIRNDLERDLVAHGWSPADVAASIAALAVSGPAPAHIYIHEEDPANRFFAWLKEDWLLKLGALLLLIALGWFTSYAFMQNWIGPIGRITLGIVSGALLLIFGWWRMARYVHQGGVFLVLGSTTILLTTYAARVTYDFFTPTSALVLMFLSVVFIGAASVVHQSRALALGGLVLAALAPLLTDSPEPSFVGLFAYLLVVVLGTLWVVALTGQRELTFASLVIISLYSLAALGATGDEQSTLLLFAYAFAGLFYLAHSVGALRGYHEGSASVDLVTAVGNGLFLIAWILVAVPQEWQSLVLSAWMVVFMVGAFILFKRTGKSEIIYIYAGVGVVMLATATAAELSGPALTIAYSIECAVAIVLAYLVTRRAALSQRLSLLLAGPALLSFASIGSSAWNESVLHSDFFVVVIITIVFLGLGVYFRQQGTERGDAEATDLAQPLLIVGSLYTYVLVWLVSHAQFTDDAALLLCMVVYTVSGIVAYFAGARYHHRGLQIYGGLLVGLIVMPLLLVVVVDMDTGSRIVTFFVVGALLVGTAFMSKKKSE